MCVCVCYACVNVLLYLYVHIDYDNLKLGSIEYYYKNIYIQNLHI